MEMRQIIKENIKKFFLSKESIAKSPKENVMEHYYGISSNGHKPMQVEGTTIDRIIERYGKDGYVVVSARRGDESEEWNTSHTQVLYTDIKRSGYSFLPMYGGYCGTDGEEEGFEPRFIVFNHNRKGRILDSTRFYQLARGWGNRLHTQDPATVKSLNGALMLNPPPCTLNERMRRGNEIFLL